MKGIKSNLKTLINQKRIELISERKKHLTINDTMQDLADFCGVGVSAIMSYRTGRAIPSIIVALRIQEYFNVSVSEIFIIEDYDQFLETRTKKPAKTCKHEDCNDTVLAKGLCTKHYTNLRSKIQKEQYAQNKNL